MSIQFYQLLHFTGIFLVFLSYGGLISRSIIASDPNRSNAVAGRKFGAIASGIGLLLILVSGFGLLAKMQYGWPAWIFIKLAIWLLLGASLVVINRKPNLSRLMWVVILLLGIAAAATVLYRPVVTIS